MNGFIGVQSMAGEMVRDAGTRAAQVAHNLADMPVPGAKKEGSFFVTKVQSPGKGGGSSMQSLTYNSVQGAITRGNGALDIAIQGEGYIPTIKDLSHVGSEKVKGTRNGTLGIVGEDTNVRNQAGDIILFEDLRGKAGPSANITMEELKPLDLGSLGGIASPTTNVSISANLPSDSAVGVISNKVETTVFNDVGGKQKIDIAWEKTALNEWKATILDRGTVANPINAPGTNIKEVTLKFDAGRLIEVDGQTNTGKVTASFTYNGKGHDIDFNFGDIGTTSNMRQFSAVYGFDGAVSDGLSYARVSELKIDQNGNAVVRYENGFKKTIAKLHLVKVRSADLLKTIDGGSLEPTFSSGPWMLATAGEGAGFIREGLESATYDTSGEFAAMNEVHQRHAAGLALIRKGSDLDKAAINKLSA